MSDSNKTEFTIRYATSADNVLLAEIGRQTFYDSFAADNTPEDMAAYLDASFSPQIQAAELAEPNTVFLIAGAAGDTVGFVRMKEGLPLPGITGSHPIEIVRFYSVKAWIGRGVGKALMQACLDEARRRGCDSVWLDVWERNPRAIAFYRKWGFVEVGKAIFKLGEDLQHDLLLQKLLNQEMQFMSPQKNLDELLNRFVAAGTQSALEKRYIQEYLESKGHHWDKLAALPAAQVKELMAAASRYASLKLAEVESRQQFKDDIKFDG